MFLNNWQNYKKLADQNSLFLPSKGISSIKYVKP